MFNHPDVLRTLVADRHRELRRHRPASRRRWHAERWRAWLQRRGPTSLPEPPEEFVLGA